MKSAADHYEVRWRVTGTQQWIASRTFAPSAEIAVDGLDRGRAYDFEVRAISSCGAASVWVPSAYAVPAAPAGTIRLDEIGTQLAAAQAAADAANAELAAIAADNVLSPSEKPIPIRDYSVILTERAGIDAQADAYGVSRTAYDNAVSALSAYLAGLTSPSAWNDVSGNTNIDGPTFRGKFADVYSARQALLNAIYAAAKTLANNAQTTAYAAAAAPGRNLVANPGWELNNVGTPLNTTLTANAPCGDGWVAAPGQWYAQLSTQAANSGARSALFVIGNGAVIPVGTTYGVVQSANKISVRPGETLLMGAFFFWNANYAIPAGVSMSMTARILFLDTNGNLLSDIHVAVSTQGFNNFGGTPLTTTGVVPSSAASAIFQYFVQVNNSNGAAVTIPAGNYYPLIAFCDDVFCYGAISDQRSLPGVTWAGVRSVLSTSPINFSISGTTVNFSVAAFTLNAGGVNINYNASSGSVAQTAGTTVTYYLYFRDATMAGGSKSLNITTSPQALAAYPDILFIGAADVTVASGGGGSGGTGGGGGGFCVADDMWIDHGTQARDAALGHPFDCCDFKTRGTATFKRALRSVEYHVTPCVRIATEHGAVLDCGISTPFDTIDGRTLRAPDVGGELVLTDWGLERVVSVDDIGDKRVCFFHFGGISYAAGVDPAHRIYSHNSGVAKP